MRGRGFQGVPELVVSGIARVVALPQESIHTQTMVASGAQRRSNPGAISAAFRASLSAASRSNTQASAGTTGALAERSSGRSCGALRLGTVRIWRTGLSRAHRPRRRYSRTIPQPQPISSAWAGLPRLVSIDRTLILNAHPGRGFCVPAHGTRPVLRHRAMVSRYPFIGFVRASGTICHRPALRSASSWCWRSISF